MIHSVKNVRDREIFVGLSGGVDSAVSAALLKEAGARVTGVFIKGWYPAGMPCTWREDRVDAMRVAARLQIPFHTLDASAEYKRSVIDYLLSEYKAGRTPNPDVMCNREVKFGAFYHYAKAKGADAIATGHYRAGDKDQSYFLALVPGDILAQTIFPVGTLEKTGVRTLAKKFDLPVAQKRDSQGVCFLGSISVKDFLRQELGDDPTLLHTIGERIGEKYVVGKEGGELVLGEKHAPAMRSISYSEANWLAAPESVTAAQYRYRGPLVGGRIKAESFVATEPLPEIPAPGQLLAFYDANRVLAGGGIIESYA